MITFFIIIFIELIASPLALCSPSLIEVVTFPRLPSPAMRCLRSRIPKKSTWIPPNQLHPLQVLFRLHRRSTRLPRPWLLSRSQRQSDRMLRRHNQPRRSHLDL
jgi:hypothetical protein